MAKKKRARAKRAETVDELQARVAAKLAKQASGVAGAVEDGRDVIRRGVLEAIDDFLGSDPDLERE